MTLLSIGGAVDDGHGHADEHNHAKRSIRSLDVNVRLKRAHADDHVDVHGDEHAHNETEVLHDVTETVRIKAGFWR